MNLVIHFFRKDLRVNRWPLLFLVIWALGIMLWYSLLPTEKRMDHIGALSLWRYFIWLMCFLIIGAQTQRDAPFREGAFFRTRPMGLSTILQSKGLYALLIVVLSATITSVSLLMLGLKPGVLDFLLIFAEEILVLSALGAVSIALALRDESAGRYISTVVSLVGVFFIGWIAFSWCKSTFFRTEKPEWSYTLEYLKTSRLLIAQFVALTGSVIGIMLFVRSGRRDTITKSLVITALCALATLFFWSLNFVKTFASPHREAPRSEWPDQGKLKFTFEEDRNWKSIVSSTISGTYNQVAYKSIDGKGRLTGLTNGWRPAPDTSYESKITLSNGKTIASRREAWATLGARAIIPALGIPSPYQIDERQSSAFQLAEFKLQDAAGAMTGAHLKGTMEIPFKRPVILARMPFRQGSSIQLGNQRIDLTNVETNLDEITYTIVQQRPLVQLRGAWFDHDGGVVDFIVIHAGRKELLYEGNASSGNNTSGHYTISKKDFTSPIWKPDYSKHPIPPDWTNGAEILVIGDENGGSFSQSFDFPNINLENKR